MQTKTTTEQRHCAYRWCDANDPDHIDHTGPAIYTPASDCGDHRSTVTVGAGVVADPEGVSIFVHIVDETGRVDEDAHLTVDEAIDLIDALILAIAHARDVS